MRIRHFAIVAGVGLLSAAAHAQAPAKPAAAKPVGTAPAATTPAAAPAAPKPGGFTYTAEKVNYRANGVRLEGSAARPARIQSPELDVTALAIAFDLEGNGIKEVRAVGGTLLKLNLSSKSGGQPAHIESKSETATLVPGERKLILKGGITGFYQMGDGPKSPLRGDSATLSYLNQTPDLALEGGKDGVLLTLPAESIDTPGAFGAVTVTAQRATFDGTTGLGRFIGNAHAYSLDGPNKMDVTAPEFQLMRAKDGTISTLRTVGRTYVKADLPPDVPAAKPAPAKPAATPAPATATPAAAASTKSSPPQFGSPTHVEATSDSAVMDRAASTLVFNGNVKGFYRLKPAEGPAQDFNFTGNQATFHFDPASKGGTTGGMSVDVIGEPVSIQVPAFNLGL